MCVCPSICVYLYIVHTPCGPRRGGAGPRHDAGDGVRLARDQVSLRWSCSSDGARSCSIDGDDRATTTWASHSAFHASHIRPCGMTQVPYLLVNQTHHTHHTRHSYHIHHTHHTHHIHHTHHTRSIAAKSDEAELDKREIDHTKEVYACVQTRTHIRTFDANMTCYSACVLCTCVFWCISHI